MPNRRTVYAGISLSAAIGLLASAVVAQMPTLDGASVRPMTTWQALATPLPTLPYEGPLDEWLHRQGCVDLMVRTSLPAKCRGANGEWISLGVGPMIVKVTRIP